MSSEKYSAAVLRDPATPLSVLLEGLHEDEEAVKHVVENPALPSDVLDVLAHFPYYFYYYAVGDDVEVDNLTLPERVAAVHKVWVRVEHGMLYAEGQPEWSSDQFYYGYADFHETQAAVASHPNTSQETLEYLLLAGIDTTSTMGFKVDDGVVSVGMAEWINNENLLSAISMHPDVTEAMLLRIVAVGDRVANAEVVKRASLPESVLAVLAAFEGDEEDGYPVAKAVVEHASASDEFLARMAKEHFGDIASLEAELHLWNRLVDRGDIDRDETADDDEWLERFEIEELS